MRALPVLRGLIRRARMRRRTAARNSPEPTARQSAGLAAQRTGAARVRGSGQAAEGQGLARRPEARVDSDGSVGWQLQLPGRSRNGLCGSRKVARRPDISRRGGPGLAHVAPNASMQVTPAGSDDGLSLARTTEGSDPRFSHALWVIPMRECRGAIKIHGAARLPISTGICASGEWIHPPGLIQVSARRSGLWIVSLALGRASWAPSPQLC